jgi:hypothetical protein
MTSLEPEKYVLDANVFIQAKRRFYALDFCPGFWDALVHHRSTARVCSIDRVWDELERGGDDLTDWARDHFGEEGFLGTRDGPTTTEYRRMLGWVVAQSQFSEGARHEFQQVADGWLVAFAKANQRIVVTLEEHNPDVRKKVPIPNLCVAHGVACITPFEMLRRLDIKLTWKHRA